MIIIGHSAILYEKFTKVASIEEIANTHSSCLVWFDTDSLGKNLSYDIAAHCHTNQVNYAVMIRSIEELLIISALMPKYIILPQNLQHEAKSFQNIIEHYLLDCKLLCVIKKDSQLVKIAQMGIDGAIFKQVLDSI